MSGATARPANEARTVEAMRAQLEALRQENQALQQQLNWLKRQIFGQKSEKRLEVSPDQMDLGEALAGERPSHEAVPVERIDYTRRKAKVRDEDCLTDEGLRFDDSVPVEVIHVSVPELEGPEAGDYEVIDEKVTWRLAQRPGSYVVLAYRRPVVKHRPSQTLSSAAAPGAVLERSLTDVSLLAGLLVDRLTITCRSTASSRSMAHSGITVSRTSLTHWVQRAIDLMRPIHDAQLDNVLRSRVLAIDETPIKAGRAKKGRMHQGWLWPIYGEAHEVSFIDSASRGRVHLEGLLEGFEGVLVCDGYSAYDSFARHRPEVTQAQSWAHARRTFVKAEAIEGEAVAEALARIGALYQVEASIREKGLEGVDKLHYRARHARPVLEAFFEWCREQQHRPELVNSNPRAVR